MDVLYPGNIHIDKGNEDMAFDCFKEALRIRKMKKGDNNMQVAESLDQIASVFVHKNDHAKAISFLEESLKIKKGKLGEDHSDVKKLMKQLEEYRGTQNTKVERTVSKSRRRL